MNWKQNERTILEVLTRHNVQPGTFLDVGVGNKSEYWVMHEAFPECRIIGLEPHPEMRQHVLCGTASCRGVRAAPHFPGLLLPYAAWDVEGFLWLRDAPKEAAMTRAFTEPPGIQAQAIPLDRLLRYLTLPQPIVLWMDVEGAELRVLRGATELLSNVAWLNLEVRPAECVPDSDWCTDAAVHDFLQSRGFELVHTYGRIRREDGGHRDVIYRRFK